jgi:hypothetical protein
MLKNPKIKNPVCEINRIFVENNGFEPMTSWLPAKRSSQLS